MAEWLRFPIPVVEYFGYKTADCRSSLSARSNFGGFVDGWIGSGWFIQPHSPGVPQGRIMTCPQISECSRGRVATVRSRAAISVVRLLAVTGILLAGCTSPSKHVASPACEPGPWAVDVHRSVYRYWLSMGPFHTTWLGPGATVAASRKKIPKVTQTSFARCAQHSFDLEHSSGFTAHVLAGPERTDQVYNLGLVKLPKAGPIVGAVTAEGQLLGRFRFDGKRPRDAAAGEQKLGTVDTQAGQIEIMSRVQVPESVHPVHQWLFPAPPELVDEYRLDGHTIATRHSAVDGLADGLISMDADLPVKSQICIVAAMSVQHAMLDFEERAASAAEVGAAGARLRY